MATASAPPGPLDHPAQAPLVTATTSARDGDQDRRRANVSTSRSPLRVDPRPRRPRLHSAPGPGTFGADMSYPPCNGMGISVVYSATGRTLTVATSSRLNSHPARPTCWTSVNHPLRQSSDDGTPFMRCSARRGYSQAPCVFHGGEQRAWGDHRPVVEGNNNISRPQDRLLTTTPQGRSRDVDEP